MENLPTETVCFCKLCIDLGSKGIVLLSHSDPKKEINDHIEEHWRQLQLLLEENKVTLLDDKATTTSKTSFEVKRTFNQNRWEFTIEKKFDQNVSTNGENQLRNKESEQNKSMVVKNLEPIKRKRVMKEKYRRMHNKTDPISNHTRAVLADKIDNGYAYCALCKKNFKVGYPKHVDISNSLSHVKTHLATKILYKCDHCQYGSKTKPPMVEHSLSIHKLPRTIKAYKDLSADHENEIIDLITRCFGQITQSEVTATPKPRHKKFLDKKRIDLGLGSQPRMKQRNLKDIRGVYCHRLVDKYGDSKNIICQLCCERVGCKYSNRNITLSLVNHVNKHLKKQLYRCRHCLTAFNTDGSLSHHLKVTHKISSVKGEYDNLTDVYHDELMAMLSKCFDKGDKKSNDKDTTIVQENMEEAGTSKIEGE